MDKKHRKPIPKQPKLPNKYGWGIGKTCIQTTPYPPKKCYPYLEVRYPYLGRGIAHIVNQTGIFLINSDQQPHRRPQKSLVTTVVDINNSSNNNEQL